MNELILTSISKEELRIIFADSVRLVLNENRHLISELSKSAAPVNKTGEFLSIDEVATLINLAKATIYALCSSAKIPHIKKGKRLYFLRADIITWLNEGKRKTNDQIQAEADAYLLSKRRIG